MVRLPTWILLASFATGSTLATRIMCRPSDYLAVNDMAVATTAVHVDAETTSPLTKRANGKVNMLYYGNWDIYRSFFPANIPASKITHILYAFADVDATTGQVILSDTFADTQKLYSSDTSSEPASPGHNVFGNFKQLYLLKQANRKLKVSLSIGGWTYSQAGHFDSVVTNANLRTAFVNSSVAMLKNLGLDGIDIDYEYPTTDAQASGFATLLKQLREALDTLGEADEVSTPYILSIAVPAGLGIAAPYAPYIQTINEVVTYWNLMAYDYAGSWSSVADNQANLYPGSASGTDTETSLNWYISNGATPSKITMGIPLYGRAFEQTDGLGKPYNGIGPGTVEPGVYDYSVLPLPGAHVFQSKTLGASYSYDAQKKELVSYDTPDIVKQKARYIQENGLAGAMFWEASLDKGGSNSLVSKAASAFDHLESSWNHLKYPTSAYDNIRNQMESSIKLRERAKI